MMPFRNYDNISVVKLLIILKILQQQQQPYCYENISKTTKKSSININHKKNSTPNSSVVKKNKISTEYILPKHDLNIKVHTEPILPKQELNIEGHTESILPKQELNIEDHTEPILPKQELNIEDHIQDIVKEDSIRNATYNVIHEYTNNHDESFISTLPIIIAEKNIEIPIESVFKLKSAALDVKAMKKEVYLTNFNLLPMYENPDTSPAFNGKLFLEGFIRNKLDFSIAKSVHDSIINLDTESVIIYIPFKCTALIPYKVFPIFSKEKDLDYIPLFISTDCVDINKGYLNYANKKNTKCKEYSNCGIPPINCEISELKIHETYTLLDRTPFNNDFPIEMNFHTINESIIITLSLTLLQNQDVSMNYRIPK